MDKDWGGREIDGIREAHALPAERKRSERRRRAEVRRWRAGAAGELRQAGALLHRRLGYGRDLWCEALTRIRGEERRWQQALAPSERASAVFEQGGDFGLGQNEAKGCEAFIDVGEPEAEALMLGTALQRAGTWVPFTIIIRLGLVLCLIERGERGGAKRLLAEADRLIALMADSRGRLRMVWLGAQAARRCGRHGSALRRLRRVLAKLLERGREYDAVIVLLEVLRLCHEQRWSRIVESRQVKVALGRITESRQLSRRACGVVTFAVEVLALPSRRRAAEVLASAHRYLIASRYRPDLPYRPLAQPLLDLFWAELDLEMRRSVCTQVDVDEGWAAFQAVDLDGELKDHIAWRFEILRRVRVEFVGGSSSPAVEEAGRG